MENPKLTLSGIITFILTLWNFIEPTAEVIFNIGTNGMAIISFIITAISFVYNYFWPEKSMFGTLKDSIGGGGISDPTGDKK